MAPTKYIRLAFSLMFMMLTSVVSGRDFVITLDAGHGGKDYGALGKFTNEKSITLSVVQQLGKLIESNLPDVKVVYTRNSDIFIPLAQRAEISNHSGSDLFMSVHINSVDMKNRNRSTIEGCQVYTLGLHKTEENLAVAKRENAVMELEADHTTKYAEFDPNSLESDIIFELSQSKRLDQSIEFADEIHRQLVNVAGRSPKGVRQAGFWVLWATSAPSVLVELDFICNPNVEKYLDSDNGQTEMVAALYNAFCAYLNTYGSGITGRRLPEAKPVAVETKSKNKISLTPTTTAKNDDKTAPHKAVYTSSDTSDTGIPEVPLSDQNTFYVQFLASAAPLSAHSKELNGFESVMTYNENGWHKYVIGPFDALNDARQMQNEIKTRYPDCFIITMKKGKRISFIK